MNRNARHLRKNATDAERKLWQHLRNRQMSGCKFRRQVPIGNYIVDFVCLEKRLIIELDGGQHAMQEDHDHIRSLWLRAQGFRVIRFWNHDVLKAVEAVREVIVRHLDAPHPVLPPRGGKGRRNGDLGKVGRSGDM